MIKYITSFLISCLLIPIMAIEERPHKVIIKDSNIEIRKYSKVVAIQVRTTGLRNDAASDAFRILVKYIKGENSKNQKISMTSPVAQAKSNDNEWLTSFYLPSSVTTKQAPTPNNPNITLLDLNNTTMAAIRFSGRSTPKNLNDHQNKLINYLKKNNIQFKPDPIYAFYNPPFVPWFLRRNEILFELIIKKK